MPRLDAEHLLTASFVDRAFGGGAQGRTGDWEGAWGAPLACWPSYEAAGSWHVPVARTWMWPGEVVVGETLARLPSSGDARQALAGCRRTGPDWTATGAATRTLDIGDESYVAVDAHELYTQLHAGARIGRDLVLLHWRQPGRVSDAAPLERALRAAVERVLGRAEPSPLPAPEPQADEAFRGFLTSAQALPPPGAPWPGTTWISDSRSELGPLCRQEQEVRLAVHGEVHSRSWQGGLMVAMDFNEVVERVAHAVDEAAAERDFAACRDAASRYDPGIDSYGSVEGLGDEAFRITASDLDGETVTVFARQGSTYLVLTERSPGGDAVALARTALSKYAAGAG